MPLLTLYCLIGSLRVHVLPCSVDCVCVGWFSPEVVALCCYMKLCFPIWTKVFPILFNVQKIVTVWASFLNSLWLGFYFFSSFVVCFCNAASSKACWELSEHYASCSMGNFFLLLQKAGGRGVHGVVTKCSLYFFELWHQHCKACCLFWTFILTLIFLTYIINVFSLQCNAFLGQSHPLPEGKLRWKPNLVDNKQDSNLILLAVTVLMFWPPFTCGLLQMCGFPAVFSA